MERYEIIAELKKYFSTKELVSQQVWRRYGEEKCWDFFSRDLLWVLLVLRRDIIKAPMTINNWSSKGSFSQRGLRANKDPMVVGKTRLYLSAHCLGMAIDFNAKGLTCNQCRELIRKNADLLPCCIRLENDKSAPTWVHIDVATSSEDKIIEFND